MYQAYKDLTELPVKTRDGYHFAVSDMLFDDLHWTVRYLVIDTHSWLPGSKKLLISPISIDAIDIDKQTLLLTITREDLLNSPTLDDHAPVSRHYEKTFFQYYGYGYYWMNEGLWGASADPFALRQMTQEEPIQPEEGAEHPEVDYHLRSFEEVLGYKLHAKDERFGHVEDFILDTRNWAVTLIAANTRNWWPGGKHVLIAPDHFTHVEWVEQEITLGLNKEDIKHQPEFDVFQPHHSTLAALEALGKIAPEPTETDRDRKVG
ncbi:MAG TPA: PRC-barrel domain containing protein [Marinagarivorans sp.]